MFRKQIVNNTCNLVAIQTVLSFYNINMPENEIKKRLPKHTFGSFVPEIGLFFEELGIKTIILSNAKSFVCKNKLASIALDNYAKVGTFVEKIPTKEDLGTSPAIINVDWYKIKDTQGKPDGHFIVVLNEKDKLMLYDGSNYDKPVESSHEELLYFSSKINRFKDQGMWLLLR